MNNVGINNNDIVNSVDIFIDSAIMSGIFSE